MQFLKLKSRVVQIIREIQSNSLVRTVFLFIIRHFQFPKFLVTKRHPSIITHKFDDKTLLTDLSSFKVQATEVLYLCFSCKVILPMTDKSSNVKSFARVSHHGRRVEWTRILRAFVLPPLSYGCCWSRPLHPRKCVMARRENNDNDDGNYVINAKDQEMENKNRYLPNLIHNTNETNVEQSPGCLITVSHKKSFSQ